MKILFVDDEEDLLEIAKGFFEDENIVLEVSSDFQEALEKVRTTKFDAIISDANMPSGSGYELFRIVRHEMGYSGKLILTSGDIDKSKQGPLYDLAVYKPIDFSDLIEKVKSLLVS